MKKMQVYGPESDGKTTFALHAIAEVHVVFSEITQRLLNK